MSNFMEYVYMHTNLEELDNENKSLVASNEEYYTELTEFREREELYDRYKYALYYAGERTDITYDQLRELKDLVEESSIPDEDLYLAWIMVESHGQEKAKNASSSASGYGQLLYTTGKYAWETLLGESNYTHDLALDGDNNMRMMVATIDHLYKYHNKDAYRMLQSYTGLQNTTYYENCLNVYLQKADKSFEKISTMYK